jgi:cyclophilin family peptidyl-prolyl cis-trans isomerase
MRKLILSIFLFALTIGSRAQVPDNSILQVRAPESFKAKFTTTKGVFVIEAVRKWSPYGADRVYQLVTTGFFNNSLLFRVEPGYLVQFGVAEKYWVNRFWDRLKIVDEPMQQLNKKGMISFARGGKDNRATQLFINMADNPDLDTTVRYGVRGFTPVARVISGMETLMKLNGQYGRLPAKIQDSLYKYGNRYFEKKFPGLDKIISAKIIR